MYVHIYFLYVCMYVRVYIWVDVFMCLCMDVCVYVKAPATYGGSVVKGI